MGFPLGVHEFGNEEAPELHAVGVTEFVSHPLFGLRDIECLDTRGLGLRKSYAAKC